MAGRITHTHTPLFIPKGYIMGVKGVRGIEILEEGKD
jgi:hypothetical protein